ncbi:MAG: hypothetical protein ABR521_14010 [Gaiellaceae bacterium]
MVPVACWLYLEGRGLTFYHDEWAYIIKRQEWDADSLLKPHVHNLSLVHVVVYKVMLATVGLDDYGGFRAMVILFHLAIVTFVFAYARRRVGDGGALVAASLLLVMGAGWAFLLLPFQVNWGISLLTGLTALVALERRHGPGDAAASVLLALSVGSSSVGLPFLAGAAVHLLWTPPRPRRLWVLAVPIVLFVGWYLMWYLPYAPPAGRPESVDLVRLAASMAKSFAAAVGGLTGLGTALGALVGLLAVILALRRLRRNGRFAGLVALVATLLSYWFLTALLRPGEGEGSRYMYVGALLLAIIAAEVLRGTRMPRPVAGAAVAAVLVATVAGYFELQEASAKLHRTAATVYAGLGALEMARATARPRLRPLPHLAGPVVVEPYFRAVDRFGSPAAAPAEIERAPERARRSADAVLAIALGLTLESRPAALTLERQAPRVEAMPSGSLDVRGPCVDLRPASGRAELDLDLSVPGSRLSVSARGSSPVDVTLRRFADGFPTKGPSPEQLRHYEATPLTPSGRIAVPRGASPLSTPPRPSPRGLIGPRQTAALELPPDRATGGGWHIRLTSQGPFSACQPR